MAIGERIRFFRTKKGMTQKFLGMTVGFPERSADVRMAQYETGSRTPKADLTKTLAGVFDVSPSALTIPDIDTDIGLMHTLFALEDIRGLTIGEIDGEVCHGHTRRWHWIPLQIVLSHHVVVGIELKTSGRTVSALNC